MYLSTFLASLCSIKEIPLSPQGRRSQGHKKTVGNVTEYITVFGRVTVGLQSDSAVDWLCDQRELT